MFIAISSPSLSRRPPWHRPSQALGAPRCTKIEAEKKAEEEKRTVEQAAWEAYVASERVRQLALWQKARARAVRVAEDARADALSAVGPKRLIYAWRYVDRMHASSQEEYLLAPDHHTGEIALAHRQAANQHLRVARLRKRRCVDALGNGRAPGHSWCAASAPASVVAFRRSIIFVS